MEHKDFTDLPFLELFMASPIATAVSELENGRILAVNSAFANMLGLSADAIVGKTGVDVGVWKSPESRQAFLEGGKDHTDLLQIRHADGKWHWVRLHLARLADREVPLLLTQMMQEDQEHRARIEHHQTAHELIQQLELYQETESMARVGYWITSIESKEVHWSPGLYQIAGLPLTEDTLDLASARAGIHPDDFAVWMEAREAMDGREVEYRWNRSDGDMRWLRTRMRRLTAGVDGGDAVIGVVQDISSERAAMNALSDQLRFMHNLAARVPGMMFQSQVERSGAARFTYLSSSAREMIEVAPEELYRDAYALFKHVHPDDQTVISNGLVNAVKTKVNFRQTVRMVLPRQGLRWFSIEASHQRLGDDVVEWHGFALDVTESRLSAQALDRQHRMLEAVRQAQSTFIASDDRGLAFNRLLDALQLLTRSSFGFIGEVLHESDGRPYLKTHALTQVKPRAEGATAPSMVLHDPETLIGRVWVTGAPVISNDPANDWRAGSAQLPADHPQLSAFIGVPVFAGKQLVAMVGLANAPSGYSMSDVRMLEPVLGTVTQLILAWRNDAERQRANEVLQATSAELAERTSVLQATLDSVIQGIMFVDGQYRIRFYNQRLLELLDFDDAVLASQPLLHDVVQFQKDRGDFGPDCELVDQTTRPYVQGNRYQHSPERYMRRTKDNRILEIYTHSLPHGGMVRTFTDVTSHVEARDAVQALNASLELRVAERTAELEQSLKDLEVISYSMAHDLRAPLRAVNGFASLIEEDEKENLSPGALDMFERIQKSSSNMGQMITDMLELMRVVQAEMMPVPVDMEALARLAQDTLQSSSPKASISIDSLPEAMGDPTFLRTVVYNLVDNSLKYSRDVEKPIVEVGFDKKRKAYFVKDNGIGFDMARAQKLFGLFQRLHAGSKVPGTGVGLAIVARIIERHGGRIWAESRPNQGATFWWTLPMA
ncbi:PAS-domain containing protein [Hydrogenophaga sp. 5NK40-0174]|uniref:ATP-binding protein n=1 Tax=Hydrogenophaga sp. 5NK40-0174 TaxID=3127649 RepID=UPI00310891FE